MKHLSVFFRAIYVTAFTCMALQQAAFAAQNSWVLPASGDWHVPANWSLGILPDSSQSVLIAAPGWKAVNINPVTSANYPASLTVHDLTVLSTSTQDMNTVLLNFSGTS